MITKQTARDRLGTENDTQFSAYLTSNGHPITRQGLNRYKESSALSFELQLFLMQHRPDLFPLKARKVK